jgi:hypothetical protein
VQGTAEIKTANFLGEAVPINGAACFSTPKPRAGLWASFLAFGSLELQTQQITTKKSQLKND